MKKIIVQSRYLVFIGVFSLLLASAAAFCWGVVTAIEAILAIFSSAGQSSSIVIKLVEITDAFLVAVALLIFSIGLYELFISDLNLPEWMLPHNLHDLKAKLSSIIILVMAIKFLEHLVEWKDPQGDR